MERRKYFSRYSTAAQLLVFGGLMAIIGISSVVDTLPRTISEITYVASTGRGDYLLASTLPTIVGVALLLAGPAVFGAGIKVLRNSLEARKRDSGHPAPTSSASASPSGAGQQKTWLERAQSELATFEQRIDQSVRDWSTPSAGQQAGWDQARQQVQPQGAQPGANPAQPHDGHWNQGWPGRESQPDQSAPPRPARPQQPQTPGARRLERINQLRDSAAERVRQLSEGVMPSVPRPQDGGPRAGGLAARVGEHAPQAARIADNISASAAPTALPTGAFTESRKALAAAKALGDVGGSLLRGARPDRSEFARTLSALTSSSLARSSLSSNSLTHSSLRTNSLFRR